MSFGENQQFPKGVFNVAGDRDDQPNYVSESDLNRINSGGTKRDSVAINSGDE